jgi:glyoxylase-like metal-dependent hydrolase (beta-lactamase superfamily II)
MPHTLDLQFQGRRGVIATAAIPCDGGVILVDPGPSSCLPTLTAGLASLGLSLASVRAVLLTHIHLDHAGSAGTLAQARPGLQVYVHEVGAKHLAAPEKLLASATRLYGADMDRLWGEFKAVPAASLRALTGGESIQIEDRTFEVVYTPGHAVHHVSYFDAADRMAYVGDTAGIVVGDFVLAATPPPDIDLERWDRSLTALEAWAPATLYLTHFGEAPNLTAHVARYRATLARFAARARDAVAQGGDDAALVDAWVRWVRVEARRVLTEEAAQAAETAAPFDQIWQGLARYWRKRAEREGAAALGAPPA